MGINTSPPDICPHVAVVQVDGDGAVQQCLAVAPNLLRRGGAVAAHNSQHQLVVLQHRQRQQVAVLLMGGAELPRLERQVGRLLLRLELLDLRGQKAAVGTPLLARGAWKAGSLDAFSNFHMLARIQQVWCP